MERKNRMVLLRSGRTSRTRSSTGVWTTYEIPPVWGNHLLQTESHGPWPISLRSGRDVGGEFYTNKITNLGFTDAPTGIVEGTLKRGYEGHQMAYSPARAVYDAERQSTIIPSGKLPSSDLVELGATAVSRVIPTNPIVAGSTAVGELFAGLPKIPGKALLATKFKDKSQYGSEYLNMQFGWLPLVSDLKDLGKAVTQSETILSQLHRDSGKRIRRRYDFPETRETATGISTGVYTYADMPEGNNTLTNMGAYAKSGIRTRTDTLSVKTWFSGAFTYYVDSGGDTLSNIKRAAAEARKLYGLEITPEVAWNLTPWSWLVDWETNVGDVLTNMSRFSQDGLVMPYGYIMQERKLTTQYRLDGGNLYGTTPSGYSLSVTSVTKRRVRANPFGFRSSMSSLTGRQLAILAALGLSRSG